MSPEVVQFLYNLLCQQQIQVGTEDFDSLVAVVSKAKSELLTMLENSVGKSMPVEISPSTNVEPV